MLAVPGGVNIGGSWLATGGGRCLLPGSPEAGALKIAS